MTKWGSSTRKLVKTRMTSTPTVSCDLAVNTSQFKCSSMVEKNIVDEDTVGP